VSALPQSLLEFIHRSIPTYQAAEVLLFLAAHPDRAFLPEEIVVAMRPIVITAPAVREYVEVFRQSGLVIDRDGRFVYGAATPELDRHVAELARAYSERPVTLIGSIYRIADSKIRSFAESFKLRRDER
jgi:hypothetical protein